MYSNFYKQSSSLADMIRSGEYQKTRAKRQVEATASAPTFMNRPQVREGSVEDEETELEYLAGMIAEMRAMNDGIQLEEGPAPMRPRSYEQGGEALPLDKQGMHLRSDPDFMAKVSYMEEKHGVTPTELFNIIKGESTFNSKALNWDEETQTGTRAAGLFQFMPASAKDLGETTESILAMSPTEQLGLYDRYLDNWGYKGEGLGIMQAAPAYRGRGDNEVIYDVGSKAWEQNAPWRPADGGAITKASINKYYRRSR